MKRSLSVLVLAAACGGKAHPSTGSASSCPTADRVVVAEWFDSGAYGDESYGGSGTKAAGWRVFLANKSDAEEATSNHYESISLADLTAAGVTAPPAVWLSIAGQPPCKAAVTGGFRLFRDEGPRSIQLGVETSGCAKPPGDALLTYGLAGDEDFSGCVYVDPAKVAEHGGIENEDHWSPSPDSTPIPAEVASLLTPHECAAPGCEAMWVATRTTDGSAYSVTRTWLKVVPGQGSCEMEHDDETAIFVNGGKGLAPITRPDDQYASSLEGLFRDASGPRLVVLDNVGTFDVYTVTPTGTSRTTTHRWYDNNEEDSHYLSMAPYCGP